MAFIEYTNNSPPYWLNCQVNDERLAVGEYTYFDKRITFGLWSPEDKIRIGKFCSLAKDITIFGGGEHIISRATTFPFVLLFAENRPERLIDGKNKGETAIGHDVWIGVGATIMSGVKIGNGAVIGAKAVVARDIPDYAIAVGNPAKIIRYRFESKTIERLLTLSWWNWDLPKILANLNLLYQNPETWAENIQFREPRENSPASLSIQQLERWKIL
ncbi:MAG: CatB-related O-acetyltransferase [Pleurocapsa sp. MO_226.B13]|nr:CatB-related O-acetyltransferase [Pleurocapsa sp. MO_226.B13]